LIGIGREIEISRAIVGNDGKGAAFGYALSDEEVGEFD
jgi:hypothetical protein